jgi:hypothetical protein
MRSNILSIVPLRTVLRIRNGCRVLERLLERLGGADVRLGRTGADADAELGAAHLHARSARQLALLDQVANRLGRDEGDIEGLAHFDSLLQRCGGTKLDRERPPHGFLTLRLEFLHAALHAVGNKQAKRVVPRGALCGSRRRGAKESARGCHDCSDGANGHARIIGKATIVASG